MPRADPTRSDYCASRHLLRNLDDAAELRRNPLARPYFATTCASPRRRDAAADRSALERIRDDVRGSLERWSIVDGDRSRESLARMHAVLLRCEIDDRPAPEVAAELGLSERQLRRERRAAHDAFARAFRAPGREAASPVSVCDVATVRLAYAVELHELGQGSLARSTFDALAANADTARRRVEALCLAAEADFDALRHASVARCLDDARALVMRHAQEFDEEAARSADEHVDFVAWSLRWQTAVCAGLATQPPAVLAQSGDDRARDEPRRALLVRAAAAYALQRWEVGDGARGRAAIRRAWDLMPTLHATRTKERLAVMFSDAQLYGFGAPAAADRHKFHVAEQLAAKRGHVHVMLMARAERIAGETTTGFRRADRVLDDIMEPFGSFAWRDLRRSYTYAAVAVTNAHSNPRLKEASAQLTEQMLPARSMRSLATRALRADIATAARRYDEARCFARSAYSDAAEIGNGRMRAAAARSLALVALGCRQRSEARRYVTEALNLTERFGSPSALEGVHAIVRRLDAR